MVLLTVQRGVNGARAAAPRPKQGRLETLWLLLSTLESYRKRLALSLRINGKIHAERGTSGQEKKLTTGRG